MFHRFHRRAPSNPTSPVPDQLTSWESAPIHEHPQTVQDISPRPDIRPRPSNPTNTPPSLPPITRVTSNEPDQSFGLKDYEPQAAPDPPRPPPARSPYNGSDTGFMGGVALQNYRRGLQDHGQTDARGNAPGKLPESHISRAKPPPPPINTSFPSRPPPVPLKHEKPASSFVTPTDLQASTVTGKRPAGTRLVSDPPALVASQPVAETQRARKGLPFLKNPMSTLLNRRKAGQNAPDGQPLPLGLDEPAYAPIRGTRFHDFSAPRPRRIASNDVSVTGVPNKPNEKSTSASSLMEPSGLSQNEDPTGTQLAEAGDSRRTGMPSNTQLPTNLGKKQSDQALQGRGRVSLDEKPLPQQPLPPVPPKDDAGSSVRTKSTKSHSASVNAPSTLPKSSSSTTTSRSRNISLSEVSTKEGVISAVPKHMKSTSSRFSFMVGSASQEQLLEERHRQKQLEKGTVDPTPPGPRDSRFDDFDEDGFDYDAMMDDDGLEERIPGVNADYDDEEDIMETMLEEEAEEEDFEAAMDPDNDQENFAGFVFQRSNAASTLTSPITPGAMATPRDGHGTAIGFAMSKETPDLRKASSTSPIYMTDPNQHPKLEDVVAGLGIQGLNLKSKNDQNPQDLDQSQQRPTTAPSRPPPPSDDDLYFDQGLADELAFGEPESGVPFDESIFDNNDTDQYGRPIPGAFAQAQAMRAATTEETAKRESDLMSRLSGHSQVSQSTAHTSLSVGLQPFPSVKEQKTDTSTSPKQEGFHKPLPAQPGEQERVAAYQAALAEAAHKAAASGKFRRGSSPVLPDTDLHQQPPAPASPTPETHQHPEPSYDYDEDMGFSQDMDDYDFDDDAIIAEANAEALAYDMDGFYGQEFGFYAAAPGQAHHGHGHSNSSSNNKPSAALNAQNLYEYASGGYFGPSGLGRSTSGHLVSREPNLTPITERSEYSNRNSIMSLAVPPLSGGGELRSPGLAQLAMMADDSDMSLSALLRLRNKAFGGSQASLVPASREGSPKSAAGEREGAISPWGTQSGYLGIRDGPHGRKNSAAGFSVRSRDSDAGSANGSPTLTMNLPMPVVSPAPLPPPLFSPPPLPQQQSIPSPLPGSCPPVLEDDEAALDDPGATGTSSASNSGVLRSPVEPPGQCAVMSPMSPPPSASSQRRPGMGHRHKGSADSISYMKEKEDESGETRWVMERRRTAESGEVEILGRQVVEGGRI